MNSAEQHNERLAMVESQVQHLGSGMARFESKLDTIGETLSVLVRIEERQAQVHQRLIEGAQRMNEQDKRIKDIELAMPQLKETRKWVVAGILGGLAMMGTALGHLVLVAPK